MADDAYLFLLPDRHPRVGAALAAVDDGECAETPAVRAWLEAHEVAASSDRVRILPAGAEALVPQGVECLPVPLSAEESARVHQECAPHSVTEAEAGLVAFRETTQDWEALVRRALTAGVPASRVAELTGLDPRDIGRLSGA
ncbi:DUF6003 family protein [Streptomyces gobitricini]|uniref:Uncharacterized protein n=1 Tax=Streptomyces gobitricini TaxID=68211 RepID=A0ABP5ZGY6_9ACTN